MSIYSEMSFFDGYFYAHCAAYEEHKSRERSRIAAERHMQRSRPRYTSVLPKPPANPVHAMQSAIVSRFPIRSCA